MDDQLSALLRQKLDYLHMIHELTLEQTKLVTQEDVTPLLESVQLRQQHIDAIDALDVQIETASDNSYDAAHEQAAQRTQRTLYVAMRSTLEKTLALDAQNEQAIKSRLLEHQASMRDIKQNIRGIQAYSAPAPSAEGMYFDKKN